MDHETLLATTFAFASFALVWWQIKFWNDFPGTGQRRRPRQPKPWRACRLLSSTQLPLARRLCVKASSASPAASWSGSHWIEALHPALGGATTALIRRWREMQVHS